MDEILNLIESVSEGFMTQTFMTQTSYFYDPNKLLTCFMRNSLIFYCLKFANCSHLEGRNYGVKLAEILHDKISSNS